jgi:glucan phosphoethanolaminetransferase (alkaline phosphatase superfamily)
MSAIAGIGFLVKYTLISGQERWIVYGNNLELYLFGMDRHEWGAIHLIIGFVLLGLLVLHIILHYDIIICVYNRTFQKKLVYKLITILFITICSLFIIVPFWVNPEISKIEIGEGRHAITDYSPTKRKNNTKSIETVKRSNMTVEIRGYMTIEEISKKFKVPGEYLKTSLNIPESVPDNQRLSWLRRKYNIEMNDVEKIIKEYQETQ